VFFFLFFSLPHLFYCLESILNFMTDKGIFFNSIFNSIFSLPHGGGGCVFFSFFSLPHLFYCLESILNFMTDEGIFFKSIFNRFL
jgi:hypothetical protein